MIHHGDCVQWLKMQGSDTADLCFADPPFNIGYKYASYKDCLTHAEYLHWSAVWMNEVLRVLKPGGAFWLAIGDEFAAELCSEAKRLGFHQRDWIIWHYTFGTYRASNYGKCKTHLIYFLKGRKPAYFKPNLVKSARLEIGDKRANKDGKIPSNVWTYPRVCGTFKQRVKHPCQMPVAILQRIIHDCCPAGGLVIDPFLGSGTTAVAAEYLGRQWAGAEIDPGYIEIIKQRLEKE